MKLFFGTVFILTVSVPVGIVAQQSEIGGLWLLKEKNNLKGPDNENGVPKIISIEQSDDQIKFEYHNKYHGKDTSEIEVLRIGTFNNSETITFSNRKKTAELFWNGETGEWIKKSIFSERGNPGKSKIKVGELFKLSPNSTEMTLLKTYDVSDIDKETLDYSILAVYEKTTPAKLARDTATGNGVRFVNGLTWKEILQKAQAERKLIFVDCYATWCLPCKKMDKEVFPLNVVGNELNEKFISVKVQMDTGRADSKDVQMHYALARKFEKLYNISALPSYLFFDSEGNIVHKGVGSFNRTRFLQTISDAADSSRQIYHLAKQAKDDLLPGAEIQNVTRKLASREFGENELAIQVARAYFENHLYKLEKLSFFREINFYSEFRDAIQSKDSMFHFFLKTPKLADSLSGKGDGFAMGLVYSVISKEEIMPHVVVALKTGNFPNWKAIEKRIHKKYPSYSKLAIVNAKTNWYLTKKDWELYCQSFEEQIDLLGGLSRISFKTLNSAAWQIFLHADKQEQLKVALKWSDAAIKNQIEAKLEGAPFKVLLDTYGNLLYKLGRKEDAIKFYKDKIINPGPVHKSFHETFDKMIKGEPTWPIQ